MKAVVTVCALVCAAFAVDLPTVPLNDGTNFPLVCLGTAGYNDTVVADAMVAASSVGLTAFDTAFNYDNQVGVGAGVQRLLSSGQLSRDDVYLITKVSPCLHPSRPAYNISEPDACYKQTMADLQSNLQQLGLQSVDMVLLHGPSHQGPGACGPLSTRLNTAQWQALMDFRAQGHSTSIGLSNYCVSCLRALLATNPAVAPAINQIALHVGMGPDPDGIVSWCRGHGILVQAYSPLASGALITDALVASVAQAYPDYSTAQIALGWIASKGVAMAVKAQDPVYIQQDIRASSLALSAADVATLDGATSPTQPASWGCSK